MPNFQETKPTRVQLAAAAVAIINQRTCETKMPSYKPLSKEMLCAVNVTHPSETCQVRLTQDDGNTRQHNEVGERGDP